MKGKWTLGLLALILGSCGALLSAGGIVLLWIVKTPVDARSQRIFRALDNSLHFVDEKIDVGAAAVNGLQQDVSSARKPLDRLNKKIEGTSVAELQRIEARMKIQLELALLMLKATGVKLKPIGEGSGVVDELPLLTFGKDVQDKGLSDHVANASKKTEDVQTTEDELRQILDDLARGQNVPENLKRLSELLTKLEQEIDEVSTELSNAKTRVGLAHDKLAELQAEFPGWWTRAVILSTLVLLWIGLAQVCLAGVGRWWMQEGNASI